jgi:hypothetical protein
VGERSISAAFGGEAIESFVMSAIDPVRIEGIAYEPAPGMGILVQWTNGGAYQGAQFALCGVTLTGSNTLTVGGIVAPVAGGGVGVLGGLAGGQPNRTIDTGETLEVAFAEPATGVAYHRSSFFFLNVAGGDEFDLEAFDAADVSLGSEHLLTDSSDIDVSAPFGNEALSRFVIETDPDGQDGQQFGSVSFQVPEPGSLASGFAGLGSAAGLARFRRRGADRKR